VNITAASARLEPVRSLRTWTSAPPWPSELAVDAVEHAGAVVEDVDVAVALAMAAVADLAGDRRADALDGLVGRERQLGLRRVTLHGGACGPGEGAVPERRPTVWDERLTQLLGGDAGLGGGVAQLLIREFGPLVHRRPG
jgi:hypothetical protein